MRALVFDGKDLKFTEDQPRPEPKSGEALVRVTRAGVCATDLEIMKGYMGFSGVPGHEFTGVVEECGDGDLVGRRVVGEINVSCGICATCMKGLGRHCPLRTVLGILGRDGVFADYVALPVINLHLVPDSVTDDEAVFAEPLAAAFEIIEQVRPRPQNRACVLGDGRLGLLCAQVLALSCEVTAVGRHPEKLSVLEKRGIKTATSGDGLEDSFDIVVEATGSAGGFSSALDLVTPRGTVVLKTTVAERAGLDLNRVVIDEITVVGSRCGPFEPALRALRDGTVDVKPLITDTFPLEKGVEAVARAAEPGMVKVLLSMEAG